MVNLEEKINFLKDKKNIPIIVNILSKLYNNGNNVRYNGIYGDYISYTTHNSYVPIKLKINDLHLDKNSLNTYKEESNKQAKIQNYNLAFGDDDTTITRVIAPPPVAPPAPPPPEDETPRSSAFLSHESSPPSSMPEIVEEASSSSIPVAQSTLNPNVKVSILIPELSRTESLETLVSRAESLDSLPPSSRAESPGSLPREDETPRSSSVLREDSSEKVVAPPQLSSPPPKGEPPLLIIESSSKSDSNINVPNAGERGKIIELRPTKNDMIALTNDKNADKFIEDKLFTDSKNERYIELPTDEELEDLNIFIELKNKNFELDMNEIAEAHLNISNVNIDNIQNYIFRISNNDCFLDSLLHIFFQNEEFVNFIYNNVELFPELKELLEAISIDPTNTEEINKIRQKLRNIDNKFISGQHDALEYCLEFMYIILEKIRSIPDINKRKTFKKAFYKIFGYHLYTKLIFSEKLECNDELPKISSISVDNFYQISIKDNKVNFDDVFNQYENNAKFTCENNKIINLTTYEKKYFGNIIMIQLVIYNNEFNKIDIDNLNFDELNKLKNYNLYGFITHNGNDLNSGHYIAYLNPASLTSCP